MEQTQLTIEQLEASKTGNKTKDRINFIQAWEKIYFSDTNEDSELFHYIVNELDELLPKTSLNLLKICVKTQLDGLPI